MNPYYWFCYHLIKLVGRIFFRLRVVHRERMINRGPVILASNHESYLDPPLVGSVADRAIFFLARKSLLGGPFFGWLLPKLNVIPVDLEGKDRSALKALIRILKAGEGTLVFPEGERTLDGRLRPALPGLGFVIAKTLAPVVPMRIFGAREAWPRGSGRCAFQAHHRRGGSAHLFYRRRSSAAWERCLLSAQPARDGRNRHAFTRLTALRETEEQRTVPKVKSSSGKKNTADPSRAPRTGLGLMLVIFIGLALVAIYANVQKARREKIERVIITPVSTVMPAASPAR